MLSFLSRSRAERMGKRLARSCGRDPYGLGSSTVTLVNNSSKIIVTSVGKLVGRGRGFSPLKRARYEAILRIESFAITSDLRLDLVARSDIVMARSLQEDHAETVSEQTFAATKCQ